MSSETNGKTKPPLLTLYSGPGGWVPQTRRRRQARDQLVELLLHPDKSPLERSDVMEACEMMREQILLAAAKKSQPPECQKQVENLCRAQVEIKPVQHARA